MRYSGAYDSARKNGWLKHARTELGVIRRQPLWTLEKCRKAWRPYKTISEFSSKNPKGYAAVKRHGFLQKMRDEISSSQVSAGYWTLKRCQKLWKACANVAEFRVKHSAAYNAVCKKRWTGKMREEIPADVLPSNYWTMERCRSAWRSCSSINDFCEKYWSAYQAVQRNDWLKNLRSELQPKIPRTDNDLIYLWRSGLYILEKPVYKIGITSRRRNTARIRLVAKKHGTSALILRMVECVDANAIERAILEMVNPVCGMTGDGVSEMFTATTKEINAILDLFDSLVLEQGRAKDTTPLS